MSHSFAFYGTHSPFSNNVGQEMKDLPKIYPIITISIAWYAHSLIYGDATSADCMPPPKATPSLAHEVCLQRDRSRQ